MRNHAVHLPNGLSFTVSPVFGGVTFKSNDSKLSNPLLPPGWNIVLSTHRHGEKDVPAHPKTDEEEKLKERSTRFTTPTLCDDSLYISYIVSPPSSEYKPVSSHARQVAMMLWVTLWWYFHEPEPDNRLQTEASAKTPYGGKPKGEWRVKIKREGIFHGRNLVQKMERMGLVMSEDSSVGADPLDLTAWDNMFMSRRVFWQIDPRIFLFTMSPQSVPHHISGIHPVARGGTPDGEPSGYALGEGPYTPSEGPFASSSHLPTYFPPLPPQYTFTNGVRHPIRSKPPHQGDVCYIRYIPSVQQYLSFRVPYLHSAKGESAVHLSQGHGHSSSTTSLDSEFMRAPSDLDLMHKWMNDPRVNAAWGEGGPIEHQENFLRQNLNSRHSFPVIGCWDGKPFGYFEIYWVKEDRLGRLIEGAGNYDRGIHLLIGEQEFRGAHRVAIWLSALVHYCWLADPRTETVMLEPRVDNEKVINYLQSAGFYKEGEVTFPHKQSALMKIRREHWECPAT